MLLSAGVITEQQLEEAIQAQVIFGGKLGTNLIDLGYTDINTLSKFLSRKHSVPTIDATHLKPCPREILKTFGKKLARKYSAVPLAVDDRRMDVLMADPTDFQAIEEMEFATGKSIKPYVAPELVVMALMERYYGIQRDIRYVQLSIRDARDMRHKAEKGKTVDSVVSAGKADSNPMAKQIAERDKIKGLDFSGNQEFTNEAEFLEMMDSYHAAAQQSANTADIEPSTPSPSITAPPPAPQRSTSDNSPPGKPPDEGEDIIDLEELVREASQWSVTEPAAQHTQGEISDEEDLEELDIIEELPEALSLAEASQRLGEVADRDELSKVVLAFALSYFKRAALFITRGGMAMGWDGMGGNLNTRTIQGIMLPLTAPSIFKTVYDTNAFYLGAAPKNQLNGRFMKLLGDEKPQSVFLIPILFRGKVVNILYGDNGHESDAPTDISELLILAPKVPQAFESLIARKKQYSTG